MFLIIPIIEIGGGQALRQVRGAAGVVYPTDPAQMAYLWRKENAKVLHVVDRDSLACGELVNIAAIRRVVRAVDIPVEVSGNICSYEQCRELFGAGVFRVVLNAVAIEDLSVVRRLVADHLPQRIVAGFTALDGRALDTGGAMTGTTAVELGLRMKQCGIIRAVYREIETQGGGFVVKLDALKTFAQRTGMRVTAAGGVPDVKTLWAVQELEPFGVDSILIGKSLYENKFPCQQVWRLVEAGALGRQPAPQQ